MINKKIYNNYYPLVNEIVNDSNSITFNNFDDFMNHIDNSDLIYDNSLILAVNIYNKEIFKYYYEKFEDKLDYYDIVCNNSVFIKVKYLIDSNFHFDIDPKLFESFILYLSNKDIFLQGEEEIGYFIDYLEKNITCFEKNIVVNILRYICNFRVSIIIIKKILENKIMDNCDIMDIFIKKYRNDHIVPICVSYALDYESNINNINECIKYLLDIDYNFYFLKFLYNTTVNIDNQIAYIDHLKYLVDITDNIGIKFSRVPRDFNICKYDATDIIINFICNVINSIDICDKMVDQIDQIKRILKKIGEKDNIDMSDMIYDFRFYTFSNNIFKIFENISEENLKCAVLLHKSIYNT